MRALVGCLAFLIVTRGMAQENPSAISGGVHIEISGFDVISEGWGENFARTIWGRCNLLGSHNINDGAVGVIASKPIDPWHKYEGTVKGSTVYEHCYQASLDLRSDCSDDTNLYHSETKCAPPAPNDPPPPPPTESDPHDPIIICDDETLSGRCSPIIINLARGPYTLSGTDDPVLFDIDADGKRDRITWTPRGSSIAFLALDRNGNHTIDDGSELFGTATLLRSGARAPNGFEALKEFDTTGDGLVDHLDERWTALLLWTDANHDGVSQPEERLSVAASVVEAIETSYHWTGRRDAHGNFFRYEGMAYLAGSRWPVYDVYFRVVAPPRVEMP